MAEKVNPSPQRPAEAFKTAGSIYYHGPDGFVVPAGSPTEISTQDAGIDETQFTAFDIQTSASSFDVTIEPGEAFVFGSWLAIDTNTTVTLGSTTTTTIYVGWDKSTANDVIVGPDDGRFANSGGDTDQKIPLWTVTTDGSGVAGVNDERLIGSFASADDGFIGGDTLESGKRLVIDSDEYMVVGGSFTIDGDADIQGDLVTVANQPSHDSLSNVDPTDHLAVVKDYQITASSGTQPAFDSVLNDVYDGETNAIDVTVAPTTGVNDTYGFNFDDGRHWNNGTWDVPLTVNWDEDPGADLDLTVRVHKRT